MLGPKDVFNMFFGIPPGARAQRRHYQYAPPRHASQQGGAASVEANGFTAMQLLPMLALLVLSLLGSVQLDAAPYELKPTASHRHERQTDGSALKYYVAESFDLDFAHSRLALHRIEEAVEKDVGRQLAKQCAFERKQQQRMFDAAAAHPAAEREALRQQAHSYRLAACEEEDALRKAARR